MRFDRIYTVIACSVALAISTNGALAQEQAASEGLDQVRKVTALLDADVYNQANEQVASMDDLILSPDGVPRFAILSRGGVAGVGASALAVPWEAFRVGHGNGKWAVTLNVTEQSLERAPKLERDNYQELMSAPYVAGLRDFYRAASPGGANLEPGPVQLVIRASKLTDAGLRSPRDEDLGEVEELLLDRNYHVAFAIVGRGGVLDIGEEFIPLPWSKLRLRVDREDGSITALTDATKPQLEKAPLVKGDDYATLLGAGYADEVRRHFGSAAGNTQGGAPK